MITHGHARRGRQSLTYQSWLNMHRRCYDSANQDFARYGGRGIVVCERWLVFSNFLADMGTKPHGVTLDRRDNDGHYSPENCRWATMAKQNRNRSSTRLNALAAVLIRHFARRGWSQGRIAAAFDVNSGTVNCIVHGRTWSGSLQTLAEAA